MLKDRANILHVNAIVNLPSHYNHWRRHGILPITWRGVDSIVPHHVVSNKFVPSQNQTRVAVIQGIVSRSIILTEWNNVAETDFFGSQTPVVKTIKLFKKINVTQHCDVKMLQPWQKKLNSAELKLKLKMYRLLTENFNKMNNILTINRLTLVLRQTKIFFIFEAINWRNNKT